MKWGLIGASTIASQHMIGAIRSVQGNKVASVMSGDAARGASYAADHGISHSTTEIDALLDQSDAVYISTTNEKHEDQALAAIAAGKHVMCEKPLAMSVAGAIKMVRAARDAGVTFGTNHHIRNAGSQLRIKELLESGEIGDLHAVRVFHAVYLPEHLQGWRLDNPGAGGGVIPDITVHDADTVRFHLNEDPASVVAMERSAGMGKGVEDSAMSVWSMPSGVMVQDHVGFTLPHSQTGIEFHGSKGTIIGRNVMSQNPAGVLTLTNGAGTQDVDFDSHNLYERSMGLFMAATRGEGQPSATGEDGVKSLAVAYAVKEAAQTGQRVDVDYGGL